MVIRRGSKVRSDVEGRSKYGSFPALRLLLEFQGKSQTSCTNYDQCIEKHKDTIVCLTRRRATIAHTQIDDAMVTAAALGELHDDLLRIFADVWVEVYGQRLTLETLAFPNGLPVQEVRLVGGLIHPIRLSSVGTPDGASQMENKS